MNPETVYLFKITFVNGQYIHYPSVSFERVSQDVRSLYWITLGNTMWNTAHIVSVVQA